MSELPIIKCITPELELILARLMDMNFEILNDNKNLKASITHRSDGHYLVEYFRWTKEVVSEFGYESEFFWEPFLQPSITDTLETAKKLAMDLLKDDI